MTDDITNQLAEQGRISGEKQFNQKGREYFSELGKRSAEKRRKDKRFGKKFYSELGKRSASSRRARRKAREQGKPVVSLPPFEMPTSPLTQINDFLKGKI